MSKSESKMSFSKWLLLLFIAFKLANIITWSWWEVLIPLYAEILVIIVYFFKNQKNEGNAKN